VAPNPFNPSTTVTFDLPRNGTVSLQIFDLRGRLVATLHRGTLPAGRHRAVWDGGDSDGRPAAAGIYLVRLDDGQERRAVKAVLAK
ncbi:MAG: FlgD immunoglobulin-like domain containing protein, partial [Candidatus Krumholzibacteria bacterium]|nr:FlgD immunoglobulin-like domain containing protein [Candidatus Krumholzibacteria bacterium]